MISRPSWTLISFLQIGALAAALPGYGAQQSLAPYHRPVNAVDEPQYVVMLHDGETLDDHLQRINMKKADFENFHPLSLINGYYCTVKSDVMGKTIRHDPAVRLIEHNAQHQRPILPGDRPQHIPSTLHRPPAPASRLGKRWVYDEFDPSYYHLQMTSTNQKLAGPLQNDSIGSTLVRSIPDAGLGVRVYVLDDGVRVFHKAFVGHDGRSTAVNFRNLTHTPYVRHANTTMLPDFDNPEGGHGTHVAGLVSGNGFGHARGATVVNVRIFSRAGHVDSANLIRALSDVVDEHNQLSKQAKAGHLPSWRGSIINLSLGIFPSHALEQAIRNVHAQGVLLVVAAGNERREVHEAPCLYRDEKSNFLCVGNINSTYERAPKSNYGKQVNVIAPGEMVLSADHTGDHLMRRLSGTSMASPLVAGISAIFMSWEMGNVNTTVQRLTENANRDLVRVFAPRHNASEHSPPLAQTGIDFSDRIPYKNAPVEPVNHDGFAAWNSRRYGELEAARCAHEISSSYTIGTPDGKPKYTRTTSDVGWSKMLQDLVNALRR
ncbi:hypothetical protein AMS68_007209 [Peltaster fructicola]|uniref:Peptidase S8/S53 domain-containing protein n=1 Tax=Peltaster fructicola TaxID=286661 RepID=A0A6H0Y3U2_9PEZI|nr:hypothetical protein AMS68_007209 [Peltaster fructicola]